MLENKFGKTLFCLYCYICITVFFAWLVIGIAENTNAHIGMHCTSTQNTWHQNSYFNVDFDSNGLLLLFFYILEKYLQFREKQKHLLKKIFGSPYTRNWIFLMRIFFKLCISQRCVYNLEKNSKNFVSIGIKNFANLQISELQNLHAIFHVRKLISV